MTSLLCAPKLSSIPHSAQRHLCYSEWDNVFANLKVIYTYLKCLLYKPRPWRLCYSVESIRKDKEHRNTLSEPGRGMIGELNLPLVPFEQLLEVKELELY